MYVSIHAPHEGERPFIRKKQGLFMTFQSTLPTRGSDVGMLAQSVSASSFNPRSPRGGATSVVCAPEQLNQVSIHAPHEGERLGQIFLSVLLDKVSIHAPHEGERHILLRAPFCPWRFNPRSPRGGATVEQSKVLSKIISFNPRSPRGGATDRAICRETA